MLKQPISRILVAALLVLVPLTSAWATHRSEAEQSIADAKQMHQKAEAAGVATATAAEMIAEAEALLETREYTQAVRVSTWAQRQDSFALEVATGEVTLDTNLEAVAEREIKAATAAADKANSVGGEWRDTRKMIKKAETLAKAGEFEQAIKEAIAARRQGELGYEQAMREKGADMPDYMRAALND
ncbi:MULTISPECIES: hypothetical protein [Thiorhodovibrio]|uniref:hypothetical protein n=1 Tax=Thiorhodovibrio TaxID=61593 RepID=UPI001913792C|nr:MULTISPECIES: hypothetical protein [Thiorhodovibrio]MBK5968829.1 hypothetical protein [Thiorhodovibrio winogradskyi]WPL12599.1 hypothetical protein Thiosp_02373 [Thiorhodovibrio litoralis]